MTTQEAKLTILALLEHEKRHLYSEYETGITLTIADKVIDEVQEYLNTISDMGCDDLLDGTQELIREKGTEMVKLLRVHGRSKDIQETAKFISQKMSAILGHNKKSVRMSCEAYSADEFGA
jgi:archaellum component FlaC